MITMLNRNYCKMVYEMNSLNAYSYSVVGDFIYNGSLNSNKIHYTMIYNVDFDLLKAHITINIISNTFCDVIEIIFINEKKYIKSTSTPHWISTDYKKSEYYKLFMPSGYLDLFDFSKCHPNNIVITYINNGILFDNLILTPNPSLITGFANSDIDIISSDSTENIYIDSSTNIIQFIKSFVSIQAKIDNEILTITGNNRISLLGINNQVNIDISSPPEN